jgi:hypothetical protein
MRREDRRLLSDLAQVNTALPAFAQRVMDNTATPAEHRAVSDRLIALGQAIGERAGTLTIIHIHPEPDNDTGAGDQNVAATRALSALVDMADALHRTHGALPARPAYDTQPVDWSE